MKQDEPPFENAEERCSWPSCLDEEQGRLLAEECRISMEAPDEPCTIYLDKYPYDQRDICGCNKEEPAGMA